jgi:hypothetical protein
VIYLNYNQSAQCHFKSSCYFLGFHENNKITTKIYSNKINNGESSLMKIKWSLKNKICVIFVNYE